MNVKRYIGAALALFVFIFFYEWLMHGVLLTHVYQSTPHVWRDFAEMTANMHCSIGLQLVLSFWLAFAFTQIYKDGGWKKGVCFGIYFGVFAGILTASWYLWLPVSLTLGISWFFIPIVQGIVGGFILGSIYRK